MSTGGDDRSSAGPEYVSARRVLLDALTALAPHGRAIIVAGAQAVYLRTGTSDIAIAPYTTDGDIALDPSLLRAEPEIERTMREAGFTLKRTSDGQIQPGNWVTTRIVEGLEMIVPIDLIVPSAAAPTEGRRAARLGIHGDVSARKSTGLEAALVDHSTMTIRSLDRRADPRSVEVEVAGVAALIIAKLHKIHDRSGGRSDRLNDKDASDVYRMMQTASVDQIASTLRNLTLESLAADVTTSALRYMDELFGRRGAPGIVMAQRALRLAVPEPEVEALSLSFTARLVSSLERSGARDEQDFL
jgi:hypothetical protein